MKQRKQTRFLPVEIDEKIEQYLEAGYPGQAVDAQTSSPTEDAIRQTVQGLQRHFAPSEDTAERVQRIWQQLERRSMGEAHSVAPDSNSFPQITDLSLARKKRTPMQPSLLDEQVTSDRYIASLSRRHFSYSSLFTAIACAILIVGGAIFTLQRLHVGQDQQAAKKTSTSVLTTDAGIYTYTQLGEYYKLDPVTHKELWHFIVPQYNDRTTLSRPIVKNGFLYMLNAGKDGSDVYALNTIDGSLKWQTLAISSADQLNLSVSVGDLVVTDTMVYYSVYSIHSGYSIIHALSTATGKNIWDMRYDNTGTINDASAGMIIQGITNNTLYAATLTGDYYAPITKLYAIDLRNKGNLLWSTSVPFIPNNGGVALLGGTAFNGVFYYGGPPESPTGFAVLYGYDIHGNQQKIVLPGPANSQITHIVEANGTLYVSLGQGNYNAGGVDAVRPQDGKVLWNYIHQGYGGSSISTVQNGTVYVTFSLLNDSSTNATLSVVALDAISGNIHWDHEMSKGVGGDIQALADSRFVYLTMGIPHPPYNTVAVLLKVSNGSPAGNFTVYSALKTEGLFIEIVT